MPGKDELRNNICSVVGVFYANRLMDEHDFLKAGPVISRLLDSDAEINGVYRGLLKCDRVYCELMGAGSSEVINEIMDEEQREFMRRMKNGLSVIRTQYAIKLLWEETLWALRNIRRSLKDLPPVILIQGTLRARRNFSF